MSVIFEGRRHLDRIHGVPGSRRCRPILVIDIGSIVGSIIAVTFEIDLSCQAGVSSLSTSC